MFRTPKPQSRADDLVADLAGVCGRSKRPWDFPCLPCPSTWVQVLWCRRSLRFRSVNRFREILADPDVLARTVNKPLKCHLRLLPCRFVVGQPSLHISLWHQCVRLRVQFSAMSIISCTIEQINPTFQPPGTFKCTNLRHFNVCTPTAVDGKGAHAARPEVRVGIATSMLPRTRFFHRPPLTTLFDVGSG